MRDYTTLSFLAFDVFGTIVDWRSGVARAVAPFLARHGIRADPHRFADEWRALYEPSMRAVRWGERAWTTLDILNRESLETLLARYEADPGHFADADLRELTKAWERLDPWPDAIDGLARLRSRRAVAAASNSHIAGMLALSRFAGLTWDVILGAEIARTYKPDASVYLKTLEMAGYEPRCAAMVAAHNYDLAAAKALGMKTIFVRRPLEHGGRQTVDSEPTGDWDLVVDDLLQAAVLLDSA